MNDFFEEDMFEDDEVLNDATDSDYDDVQYILELMETGMDICEEAVNTLDKLVTLNNKLGGSEITGVNQEVLLAYKTIFEKVIPDLIAGENLDLAIQTVKNSLNTSDNVAKEYVDNKRTMLLEAIENNKQ